MRNESDPGPYIVGGIAAFLALFGGVIIACLWFSGVR